MGYNCERTKPVKRGPWLTNNGYWCKDNKADGPILTMSTRVNREGLTQCPVLLLQWGMERARCPEQQCLLNQGQQGWGPKWAYNCYITRTTANIKMLIEWAIDSVTNPTTIISMSSEWDLFSMHERLRPGNAWLVAVISLLAAQERSPEPTQVVKALELL